MARRRGRGGRGSSRSKNQYNEVNGGVGMECSNNDGMDLSGSEKDCDSEQNISFINEAQRPIKNIKDQGVSDSLNYASSSEDHYFESKVTENISVEVQKISLRSNLSSSDELSDSEMDVQTPVLLPMDIRKMILGDSWETCLSTNIVREDGTENESNITSLANCFTDTPSSNDDSLQKNMCQLVTLENSGDNVSDRSSRDISKLSISQNQVISELTPHVENENSQLQSNNNKLKEPDVPNSDENSKKYSGLSVSDSINGESQFSINPQIKDANCELPCNVGSPKKTPQNKFKMSKTLTKSEQSKSLMQTEIKVSERNHLTQSPNSLVKSKSEIDVKKPIISKLKNNSGKTQQNLIPETNDVISNTSIKSSGFEGLSDPNRSLKDAKDSNKINQSENFRTKLEQIIIGKREHKISVNTGTGYSIQIADSSEKLAKVTKKNKSATSGKLFEGSSSTKVKPTSLSHSKSSQDAHLSKKFDKKFDNSKIVDTHSKSAMPPQQTCLSKADTVSNSLPKVDCIPVIGSVDKPKLEIESLVKSGAKVNERSRKLKYNSTNDPHLKSLNKTDPKIAVNESRDFKTLNVSYSETIFKSSSKSKVKSSISKNKLSTDTVCESGKVETSSSSYIKNDHSLSTSEALNTQINESNVHSLITPVKSLVVPCDSTVDNLMDIDDDDRESKIIESFSSPKQESPALDDISKSSTKMIELVSSSDSSIKQQGVQKSTKIEKVLTRSKSSPQVSEGKTLTKVKQVKKSELTLIDLNFFPVETRKSKPLSKYSEVASTANANSEDKMSLKQIKSDQIILDGSLYQSDGSKIKQSKKSVNSSSHDGKAKLAKKIEHSISPSDSSVSDLCKPKVLQNSDPSSNIYISLEQNLGIFSAETNIGHSYKLKDESKMQKSRRTSERHKSGFKKSEEISSDDMCLYNEICNASDQLTITESTENMVKSDKLSSCLKDSSVAVGIVSEKSKPMSPKEMIKKNYSNDLNLAAANTSDSVSALNDIKGQPVLDKSKVDNPSYANIIRVKPMSPKEMIKKSYSAELSGDSTGNFGKKLNDKEISSSLSFSIQSEISKGIISVDKLEETDSKEATVNIKDDFPSDPKMEICEKIVAPVTIFDPEKPVKVKSRWRRTSELELGSKINDHDISRMSLNESPVSALPSPQPPPVYNIVKDDPVVLERLKSYIPIDSNDYLTERYVSKETKRMVCDCSLTKDEISKGEKGCGEDCLNRLLFIECGSRCSLGNLCSNKRFMSREYSVCEVVDMKNKGVGVVSAENIPRDQFIMEYVGEVLGPKEFEKRAREYAKEKNTHFYFMSLKNDTVIDATVKGNVSRFINHSCDPNAETQKWTVNGELRIGFFSKRPIAVGEEITFDYQLQRYGKEAQKCLCGSANCRGWLGQNPDDDEDFDMDDEDEDEEDDEMEGSGSENDKKVEKDKIKVLPPKPKKDSMKKERKRIESNEVLNDLDEDIEKLNITGLKNQKHTLTLSRLMVRADDVESRSKLLEITKNGDTRCLRLFLDYNGLNLILTWMMDPRTTVKLKLKILEVLAILPIQNKTVLKDSKILGIVQKWANCQNIEANKERVVEEDSSNSPDEKSSSIDENVIDKEVNPEEDTSSLVEPAARLNATWALLKEEFRIPKKQRVEQMKEHEREANMGYSDPRDNISYSDRRRWRDRKESRFDRVSRFDKERKFVDEQWMQEGMGCMTKAERRQLFALKVEREEREKKESERMWWSHREQCAALGVDPLRTAMFHPATGAFLYYHSRTASWHSHPESLQEENYCNFEGSGNYLVEGNSDQFVNYSAEPGYNVDQTRNNSGRGSLLPTPPLPQLGPPRFIHQGPPPLPPHHQQGPPPPPHLLGGPHLGPNHQLAPPPPGGGLNQRPGFPHHLSQPGGPSPQSGPPLYPLVQQGPPINPGHLAPPLPPPPHQPPSGPLPPHVPPLPQGTVIPPLPHHQQGQLILPSQLQGGPPIPLPTGGSTSNTVPPLPPPHHQHHHQQGASNHPISAISPLSHQQIPHPPGQPTGGLVVTGTPPVQQLSMPQQQLPAQSGSTQQHISTPNQQVFQNNSASIQSAAYAPQFQFSSPNATPDKIISYNAPPPPPPLPSYHPPMKLPPKWRAAKDKEGRTYYYHVKTRKSQWTFPQATETIGSDSFSEDESDSTDDEEEEEEEDEDSSTDNEQESVMNKMDPSELERNAKKRKLIEQGEGSPVVKRPPENLVKINIIPRDEVEHVKGISKSEIRDNKEQVKREKMRARRKAAVEKVAAASSGSAAKCEADTSYVPKRRFKDLFRLQMADVVVACLSQYRKPDCKSGRITSTEDFKQLARKLTHFIMLKELKHCMNIKDLQCNDNVKHKARDFIRKYMAKFGAVYVHKDKD